MCLKKKKTVKKQSSRGVPQKKGLRDEAIQQLRFKIVSLTSATSWESTHPLTAALFQETTALPLGARYNLV